MFVIAWVFVHNRGFLVVYAVMLQPFILLFLVVSALIRALMLLLG